ncbi:MAG: hypothetical protein WBE58_21015 [Verrucomicrobiales bacterium]
MIPSASPCFLFLLLPILLTADLTLEAAGVPITMVTVEGGGQGKGFGPAVEAFVSDFLTHALLGTGEAPSDAKVKAGK